MLRLSPALGGFDHSEEDVGVVLDPQAGGAKHSSTPFGRDLILTVVSSQECSDDGAVRVGVATAVHDVNQGGLERGRVYELPDCETECDAHEPGLRQDVQAVIPDAPVEKGIFFSREPEIPGNIASTLGQLLLNW